MISTIELALLPKSRFRRCSLWVVHHKTRSHSGAQNSQKAEEEQEGHQRVNRETVDALARKFAATHEMNVKAEIGRLSNELAKLDRPWVFVSR